MDQIINNSGLQNITEMIFLNLDSECLKECQHLNKSSQQILANPMFWLKKWKGLSKETKKDWTKAIQITRNTHLERNVLSYIKKAIKIGHVLDVPCYINENVVEKSNEFTFETALNVRNLGMLQIYAPMVDYPNRWVWVPRGIHGYYTNVIANAAKNGNEGLIKVLAPLIVSPNHPDQQGITPIQYAVFDGKEEALKVLATFPTIFDEVDDFGLNLMHLAAARGHINILRILVPLMKNPNAPSTNDHYETPIDFAKQFGHDDFARILQSYIK